MKNKFNNKQIKQGGIMGTIICGVIGAIALIGAILITLKDYNQCEAIEKKDPYGIQNVCFSLAEKGDKYWDAAKKDRIERGFDNTELWNLDVTILKFTLPRLKLFRDNHDGCPAQLDNDEVWKAEIDKMIFWMEKYIEDDWVHWNDEVKSKMDEGKQAFFKYFEFLWD